MNYNPNLKEIAHLFEEGIDKDNNGIFNDNNTRLRNFFGEIDPEIEEKREEYLEYINDHIGRIFNIYLNMKYKIDRYLFNMPHYHSTLFTNITNHDKTKYSLIEFEPYRVHFYPTTLEKENITIDRDSAMNSSFRKAWRHHYEHNSHHPEHWYNNDFKLNMDIDSIIEMVIDWAAMSEKFNDDLREWWNEKRDEIPMTEYTKQLTDEIINTIFY